MTTAPISNSKVSIDIENVPLLNNEQKRVPKKVTWSGIVATVPQKKGERKTVLREVSGVAYPREVLAMMGGSGAGKTTLMNILAHLPTKGVEFQGNVFVNGAEVDQREMRQISAYVQQHDMFCGTLTVREQLVYSAMMRMPSEVPRATKIETVANLITEMNLTDCQDTLIGIPGRLKGISIGEKKRLAFACELLTDPDVIFCDEPTSGLDAFMASQVVQALLNQAAKGKAIITVLHQPSSIVFKMFHKVCFMANGKTAYHGPVDQLCPFLNSLGPELRVPENYNPADFVIAKLSMLPETQEKDRKRIEERQSDPCRDSEVGRKTFSAANKFGSSSRSQKLEEKVKLGYASTFLMQFWILLLRSFKTTIRDPMLLKVRFIQIVITAFVIGLVNFRTQISGPTIQNLEGVMYNCARDMTFLFYFPSVNVITSELPVFLRETKARIYSVHAYYLAKNLAEIPQYTALPMIYATLVYWMTGFESDAFKFLIFVLVCIQLTWIAVSLAYVGACIFFDEGLVVTYMPMFVLPMLVFGGFYINAKSIPSYFQAISNLSWFKHGFEALEVNQWGDYENINCGGSGSKLLYCPAKTGDEVLDRRSIDTTVWLNIGIMAFSFVAYRAIGLVALLIRVRFTK
ncbi:unnamed protein product [Caenorhabditis auriculariae]|uniref:ABC transporter domain-containing protein n=1 Tax=Caenorhabditis auriculariae TaxID=2777116 RepID=A0A8S1HJ37_9PELO|nr:unnamed protein product [Caenorhabditis auriculariae]